LFPLPLDRLGIAQVSKSEAEYEGHVRRIFGQQYEMDL